MSIIYAPLIADTIPGFVITSGNTVSIKIPFTMNPAVTASSVWGFSILIKTYDNTYTANPIIVAKGNMITNGEITFTTTNNKIAVAGQYYKFQIGYKAGNANQEEEIKYSTVSIGKCIGNVPIISINNLTSGNTNNKNRGVYYGNVNFGNNSTEKIYSYQFKLFNANNNLIEDSGEILKLNDNCKYRLKTNIIQNDVSYKLQFFITTINGYKGESEQYKIVYNDTSISNIQFKPFIKNIEEGYIEIPIFFSNIVNNQKYLLERTLANNPKHIDSLFSFTIESSNGSNQEITWKDYTIEHGVEYKYYVRKISNTDESYNSEPEISDPVSLDYEHMYLTGINGRQLKIRLDPKISSFKDILLEQKTDTIGGKYPFFFRNNQVNYKEIGISGLISYYMDENEQFMTNTELGLEYEYNNVVYNEGNIRTTNLTEYNIYAERVFREEIIKWLNNGEPKLFRSPTEGVYIIRLMNVSVSPNDTLGRMLYTFSTTGYEVSDHDIETIFNKNLINSQTYTRNVASRLGYFILGTSTLGGIT